MDEPEPAALLTGTAPPVRSPWRCTPPAALGPEPADCTPSIPDGSRPGKTHSLCPAGGKRRNPIKIKLIKTHFRNYYAPPPHFSQSSATAHRCQGSPARSSSLWRPC